MDNKFKRIGAWWALWIISTIVFVDFLPQHPHLKYEVLLSPFILVMGLIVEPYEVSSQLLNRFDPSSDLPGICFWIITILLFFFPHTRKKEQSKSI